MGCQSLIDDSTFVQMPGSDENKLFKHSFSQYRNTKYKKYYIYYIYIEDIDEGDQKLPIHSNIY
jgi:hypothetical protein